MPPLAATRRAPHAPPRAATVTVGLAGGARTTVHVTAHDLDRTELFVAVLDPPRPLTEWSAGAGVSGALGGGFYLRGSCIPLGELRTHGVASRSEPFLAPWGERRSCLHVDGGRPRIAARDELPRNPRGDLLQAGPLLVRGGRLQIAPCVDPEGFSAGSAQFDSDITVGRHPRAALGLGGGFAFAVACDGRTDSEAGLTLLELAQLMAWLGARDAINLDGGGSTSLAADGALVNRPRDEQNGSPHGGRRLCTAIGFKPFTPSSLRASDTK